MRWSLAHTLDAPRALVERRLLSAERIAAAPDTMRTVREATLLGSERGERVITYAARFVVRDTVLPAALRRFASAVAWVERVTWSLDAHVGDFVVEPELPPALKKRVRCMGHYALHAPDPLRTTRTVEIELAIAVPFAAVRDAAEGAVRTLLEAHFDDEARDLACGARSEPIA